MVYVRYFFMLLSTVHVADADAADEASATRFN